MGYKAGRKERSPPPSLSLVLKEKKKETCTDLHRSRYDFIALLRNPAKLLNTLTANNNNNNNNNDSDANELHVSYYEVQYGS